MTKRTCPECGSENVSKDAAARWDETANEWTLSCVHDCETCDDCGAERDWLSQPEGEA